MVIRDITDKYVSPARRRQLYRLFRLFLMGV